MREESMSEEGKSFDGVLESLIQTAVRNGASDAKALPTTDVTVDDSLAGLCRESGCENFGLSAHCPPHVSGPSGFKTLLKDYTRAVVFKIDVPTETLLSSDNREAFRALQTIAAAIEAAAVEKGFGRARAFAGGSCKALFCNDHGTCRVLSEDGECRHPDAARPSMSGFGVYVAGLARAAGWDMDRITRETDPDAVRMGMLCGLVLVG